MRHTIADVEHNAGHQALRIEREERLNGDVSPVKVVLLEHRFVDTLSVLVWRGETGGLAV